MQMKSTNAAMSSKDSSQILFTRIPSKSCLSYVSARCNAASTASESLRWVLGVWKVETHTGNSIVTTLLWRLVASRVTPQAGGERDMYMTMIIPRRGATSQMWITKGEKSGLWTRIAKTSGVIPKRVRQSGSDPSRMQTQTKEKRKK
jgi:hypothetical protein